MQYQLRLKSGGTPAKKKICCLERFKSEEEKVVMKQFVVYKCLEFIKCILRAIVSFHSLQILLHFSKIK